MSVNDNEVFRSVSTTIDPPSACLAGQRFMLVSFVAPEGWGCTNQFAPCLAFKVRGTFATVDDAMKYRDMLEKEKLLDADVFICPLNMWAPLPPDRSKMSMRNTVPGIQRILEKENRRREHQREIEIQQLIEKAKEMRAGNHEGESVPVSMKSEDYEALENHRDFDLTRAMEEFGRPVYDDGENDENASATMNAVELEQNSSCLPQLL